MDLDQFKNKTDISERHGLPLNANNISEKKTATVM